jgi:hypothetical protein
VNQKFFLKIFFYTTIIYAKNVTPFVLFPTSLKFGDPLYQYVLNDIPKDYFMRRYG